MFSLVPVTDCPYSNSRQLLWLSTLGADTVHGSHRHIVQPGRHTHRYRNVCKCRCIKTFLVGFSITQSPVLLQFDKRTLTGNVITDLLPLLMIRDMSSPPVASPRWCVCAWDASHSDNYYTARMNRLREDTGPAHDNLIKPHKDKNRIKEGRGKRERRLSFRDLWIECETKGQQWMEGLRDEDRLFPSGLKRWLTEAQGRDLTSPWQRK